MQPNREGLRLATVMLVAANVVIPIAILTFAKGFFPYKPSLSGLSKYEDVELGLGPPPSAPFDKLVFMVVDALRSDFVFSEESGFDFTQSLIRNGNAIPFTAHATSPTVTMPRIKAITTGSIPSFLDVILNINEGDESSSLASQDTWLAQMKAKATGKLVMHGDDTWLKLFPGTFDRSDGTSSFFVADFSEVDNNVTRHITPELNNNDWSTMVLHYLGLDHIGHKGGPRSPYMAPKQREMDQIIKEIYSAIESQPALQSTLLVVCGDHGMNDAGNHGASSPGETSPALVFMSPKLKALQKTYNAPVPFKEDFNYYSVVEQSDLAPTLGALLGFPVPKNNLGALIPEFLPFWSSRRDQTQLLLRNAYQILGIVEATYGKNLFTGSISEEVCIHGKSDLGRLACDWKRILNTSSDEITSDRDFYDEWVPRTVAWLRKAQSIMSSMASNYDMRKLKLGQSMSVAAIGLALGVPYLLGDEPRSYIPLSFIRGLYSVMMFASSYVEEEHHFWYWFTTAWLAYIGFRRLYFGSRRLSTGDMVSINLGLLAMRLLRSWNQTGQKFAGDPDIVRIFLRPNPTILWSLIIITYFWIYRELIRGFNGLPTPINITGTTTVVLAALSFKLAFTHEESPEIVPGFAQTFLNLIAHASLLNRARVVFIGLAIGIAWVVFSMVTKLGRSTKATGSATVHHLFTLLAMTQSRATNIPLFLILDVIFKYIGSQPLTPEELSTTTILLQFATFFAFGGTNSISSVDLSNAYNGISDFNIVPVGVLTFVGNWAGSIYWAFATNTLLLRKSKAGADLVFHRHATVLTMFTAASVGAIMVACTVMRTHLFIWTVFSPKYLYCMAWTFGQHLTVNIGLGGLLYWIGWL